MLAYPIPEAEELLQSKLAAAKTSLANCQEDMEFLREQITVQFMTRKPACAVSDLNRLWRSHLRECITGMLRSGGKRD